MCQSILSAFCFSVRQKIIIALCIKIFVLHSISLLPSPPPPSPTDSALVEALTYGGPFLGLLLIVIAVLFGAVLYKCKKQIDVSCVIPLAHCPRIKISKL